MSSCLPLGCRALFPVAFSLGFSSSAFLISPFTGPLNNGRALPGAESRVSGRNGFKASEFENIYIYMYIYIYIFIYIYMICVYII